MSAGRGQKRRDELIEAGVALLSESGWRGVTQRAVAARAGANPGLVHYYFAGSARLRVAVAERASRRSIGGTLGELLSAPDEAALIAGAGQALARLRAHPQDARLIAEIASAAFDQPDVAAVVRAELARGRALVERWLAERHPAWSPGRLRGVAAALVALLDGMVLHLVLDTALAAVDLTDALRALIPTITTEQEPEHR